MQSSQIAERQSHVMAAKASSDNASMRFHGFDFLRVAGMLAVIYIHGCDTHEIAQRWIKYMGFAVPCFFMMSAFLAQQSLLHKETSFIDWMARKFRRLAPSYFAWSVVYFTVRCAKSMAVGEPLHLGVIDAVFLGGTAHHLYFVPFLFYSFLLWTGLMMLAKRHRITTTALLVLSIVTLVWQAAAIEAMLPSNCWFFGRHMAWFPIGMLLAIAVDPVQQHLERLFWPILILLIAMLIGDFMNIHACSTVVFALAVVTKRPAPGWVQRLSLYSFGVYLSHVLFIEGMQFVGPRIGLHLHSFFVTMGIMVIAAVLSYATCLGLGQSRWTRWSVT